VFRRIRPVISCAGLLRVGFVTWIAFGVAAGFGATASAQSITPPPVESPPIGAPAPVTPAVPLAGEDPRPGQALTACASGEVAKGIDILARLYAETRNPSFVFNQARCYQQNGQLEKSRERFREYLRIGKNEPPADIKRAEHFIKELDRELALQRAVQDARPQERRYRGALRTTSIVLAATGVAAIGTGALLGLQMKKKEDQIARQFEPNRPGGPDNARVSDLVAEGTRLETWQYISYGVGVAALAGAATTFGLSGWTFREEVTVTPVLAGDHMGGTVRVRF
jgi:hypothetical protein